MSVRPWLRNRIVDLMDRGPPYGVPSNDIECPDTAVHTTACKHGDGPCEACGTTNRRDRLHTTDGGGRGTVGRIRR